MNKLIYIFLAILITFSACKKEDEEISPFIGYWSGFYIGDENGSWNGNISANGDLVGEANTTDFGLVVLTGEVTNNGEFQAAIGSGEYGITFFGEIDSSYANGEWTSTSGGSGDWEGYNYNQ